jgi:Tfp pilus assembly protein PilF
MRVASRRTTPRPLGTAGRASAAAAHLTLATVQYRNGDWRDSLTSLDKAKAAQKEFDAMDWLLVAMNRHQLKQKEDARGALRKAVAWMEEQQRKAEDDARRASSPR